MPNLIKKLLLGSALAAVSMTPALAQGGVIKWFEFYSISSDQGAMKNAAWVKSVIAQFESENPGWTVQIESAQWDQIDQRSILDLNANVPHDVMFSSPQLMAKHFEAGDYLDLSPLIGGWSEDELNDLNWSAGWHAASFGDRQIGIPLGVHIRANAYNRDMFEAAGLDPDAAFTSLDEVVDAGKALTNSGEGIWGLGLFMGNSRATIELTYAPLVWHYGGDFYDAATKQATLAGEASVKAVEWLYDAVHTSKITPPYSYASDADYGNLVNDMFMNGEVAQTMGFGSYWIANMEDAGMVEGCFPASAACKVISGNVMVQPGSVGAQFANSWNLSIHSLSENPEMAMKLIEVALRAENLAVFPDAGLPARLSMWDASEYSSEFWSTWRAAAEKGRAMPSTAFYPELADAAAAAIQEALAGDRDGIQATLAAAEQGWNDRYGSK